MTTAHRPTWAPAKGGEEQGGTRIFAPSRHFSAKDQPAHQQLKRRSGPCCCRLAAEVSRLAKSLSSVSAQLHVACRTDLCKVKWLL